jgi:hypothetical protein
MNDSSGPFGKRIQHIAFRGLFCFIFFRMRECSMSFELIRMSIVVRGSSSEWHFAEEGVYIMEREERNGVKESSDQINDTVSSNFRNRWEFNLRSVEIRESSIGSAKGSAVFVDGWSIACPFVFQKVSDERVYFKTSFGNRFRSCDDLRFMVSERKSGDASGGLSVGRNFIGIDVHIKFEGFAFHVV